MNDTEQRLFDLLMLWFTEDVTFLNREFVAENLFHDIISVMEEAGWTAPNKESQADGSN